MNRFLDFSASAGLTRKVSEQDPRIFQAVRHQAERAKRQLSQSDSAQMSLHWKGTPVEFGFTQDDLRSWAEPLLARIRQPVERALRDARIRTSQLNEILLVGGATRMPLIRSLVAKMFGRFPSAQIHPDEAVALGAAVQAGLKARDSALKEVVLTDVCPYTLGVEVGKISEISNRVQTGFYSPIIERNTVIPASRVERYFTLSDRQALIEMRIFQGEARMVRDNILLGQISMPVPAKPKGEESIDVRFTYDINGLLEVEGTVVSTGKKKSVVIEESPGALSPEEIRASLARLSKLKIHPRDQVENRTLLARADRLFEQSLGTARDFIGARTSEFSDLLAGQNPREIERYRQEFTQFLDSIESRSPLSDGSP
jgi:molecular chaperone HscC